jgi:ring-1,2-phenylacetyl-CoA epoxidase subunit PaaC
MDQDLQTALAERLLALADDELILGHRDSEWTGHAPILEEDIAFANIALDELGHAKIWYGLLAELRGEDPDTYPDQLIFFRAAPDYRCAQIVELPRGDWAFTILRQYFFDAAEVVTLGQLTSSLYQPLAGAAAKIQKEEVYHYRHTYAWTLRLGQGTEESHRRMQNALDHLWPYAAQLFGPLTGEAQLMAAGYVPESGRLQAAWVEKVKPVLDQSGLMIPVQTEALAPGRERHSDHLERILTEMQQVARTDARARW